jgi:hypothetical protein
MAVVLPRCCGPAGRGPCRVRRRGRGRAGPTCHRTACPASGDDTAGVASDGEGFRMAYVLFVHSTAQVSSTLYDMATKKKPNRRDHAPDGRVDPGRPPGRHRHGEGRREGRRQDRAHQRAGADKTARQQKASRKAASAAEHSTACRRTSRCSRSGPAPTDRSPAPLHLDQIAAAAIRIADAEGATLRRCGACVGARRRDHDAHHYIRTKDELLALVGDAIGRDAPRRRRAATTSWRAAPRSPTAPAMMCCSATLAARRRRRPRPSAPTASATSTRPAGGRAARRRSRR